MIKTVLELLIAQVIVIVMRGLSGLSLIRSANSRSVLMILGVQESIMNILKNNGAYVPQGIYGLLILRICAPYQPVHMIQEVLVRMMETEIANVTAIISGMEGK